MLNVKYLDQTDCIILHNLLSSIYSMPHFSLFLPAPPRLYRLILWLGAYCSYGLYVGTELINIEEAHQWNKWLVGGIQAEQHMHSFSFCLP